LIFSLLGPGPSMSRGAEPGVRLMTSSVLRVMVLTLLSKLIVSPGLAAAIAQGNENPFREPRCVPHGSFSWVNEGRGIATPHGGDGVRLGGDGVRLCSWFLRAVFETKNKV